MTEEHNGYVFDAIIFFVEMQKMKAHFENQGCKLTFLFAKSEDVGCKCFICKVLYEDNLVRRQGIL